MGNKGEAPCVAGTAPDVAWQAVTMVAAGAASEGAPGMESSGADEGDSGQAAWETQEEADNLRGPDELHGQGDGRGTVPMSLRC